MLPTAAFGLRRPRCSQPTPVHASSLVCTSLSPLQASASAVSPSDGLGTGHHARFHGAVGAAVRYRSLSRAGVIRMVLDRQFAPCQWPVVAFGVRALRSAARVPSLVVRSRRTLTHRRSAAAPKRDGDATEAAAGAAGRSFSCPAPAARERYPGGGAAAVTTGVTGPALVLMVVRDHGAVPPPPPPRT